MRKHWNYLICYVLTSMGIPNFVTLTIIVLVNHNNTLTVETVSLSRHVSQSATRSLLHYFRSYLKKEAVLDNIEYVLFLAFKNFCFKGPTNLWYLKAPFRSVILNKYISTCSCSSSPTSLLTSPYSSVPYLSLYMLYVCTVYTGADLGGRQDRTG